MGERGIIIRENFDIDFTLYNRLEKIFIETGILSNLSRAGDEDPPSSIALQRGLKTLNALRKKCSKSNKLNRTKLEKLLQRYHIQKDPQTDGVLESLSEEDKRISEQIAIHEFALRPLKRYIDESTREEITTRKKRNHTDLNGAEGPKQKRKQHARVGTPPI